MITKAFPSLNIIPLILPALWPLLFFAILFFNYKDKPKPTWFKFSFFFWLIIIILITILSIFLGYAGLAELGEALNFCAGLQCLAFPLAFTISVSSLGFIVGVIIGVIVQKIKGNKQNENNF